MQVGCDIPGPQLGEQRHISPVNKHGGRLDPDITAGGYSCATPPTPCLSETLDKGRHRMEASMHVGRDISGTQPGEHRHISPVNIYG